MATKIVKLLKGEKSPVTRGWQLNPIDSDSPDGKRIMELVAKGYVNYGIHAGASELLIVDVDPKNGGDPQEYFEKWPKTHVVRTPSGGHHFYYRWAGSKDLSGQRKPKPGVDFIVGMSQAVGPGSTVNGISYEVIVDAPIAEAPAFGIAQCLDAAESKQKGANLLTDPDATEEGRNNSLVKTMGILQRGGLAREHIEAVALTINSRLSDPLPESEVRNTVIKSALQWEEEDNDPILTTVAGLDDFIGTEYDLPAIGEKPIRWIVDDFVPEDELTIIWGGPKVGKSTFCAWVGAKASKQHKRVLFVGAGEERAEVFAAKFRESGGDMAYFDFWKGPALKFPKYADFFTKAISNKGYGLVYFDSLRAVMETAEKKNEADRSRDALQPIATMAQTVGVSILLTTHPMKARASDPVEVMLGSTELKAVARCVLHAVLGETDQTFFVKVDATNTRKPDEDLMVARAEKPFCDHRTGAVQTEIRENGTSREVTIPYIANVSRIKKGTGHEARSATTDDSFSEKAEAFAKAHNDGVMQTPEDAMEMFGMPKDVFFRYRNKLVRAEHDSIRTEIAS